jgi:sugar/nucleoside kinase (ribokinase family)
VSLDTIDIITSGHICLNLSPHMDNIPLAALTVAGRLYETDALTVALGGAAANTGLMLHHLGANVRLLSAVGDDRLGNVMVAALNEINPDLTKALSIQTGLASPYTILLAPADSDEAPVSLYCPGTNITFGMSDVNFALLGTAKMFHLAYPALLPQLLANSGEELGAIYQQAKTTGVVTSLDLCMPPPGIQVDWLKILSRTLPYVDVFVPNIIDALHIFRRADYEAWGVHYATHLTADYLAGLAQQLLELGPVVIGFKLGSLGLYMQTASVGLERLERLPLRVDEWTNALVWSPAYGVARQDLTSGPSQIGDSAGDAMYAGLLAALLRGLSPSSAARRACAVAASFVEAGSAAQVVPQWDAIEARIQSGWPLRMEQLTGYGSA